MQNRIFILVLALLLIAAGGMAQKKEKVEFQKFIHGDKGESLPYRLLSPKTTPGEKYPLIIFLHGAGERGIDNENQLKHIEILTTHHNVNKYPSFVLAPQCPQGKMWSEYMQGKPFNATPTRVMEMLMQLVDQTILQKYPIDASRIYITGVSMGGYGTWDLMARYPKKFAAAVPICGGGDEKTASVIKDIPVWAFHGALDDVVPPQHSRKMINALIAEGAKPGYTEYPHAKHPSWNFAYKEPQLMVWLFKQKRGE